MSDYETIDETIQDKIQNLVVFMCNECGQGSANTAGVARMGYDPAIRIIRVQCTGQIGPIQIMDALNNGADAVACVGCCSLAPVIMIRDRTHGRLTPALVRKLLRSYRRRETSARAEEFSASCGEQA